MYIVAIAWTYVVFMMSVAEQSVIAGVMTFMLYGIFPLAVILYLMGVPQRKRRREEAEKIRRATSDLPADHTNVVSDQNDDSGGSSPM